MNQNDIRPMVLGAPIIKGDKTSFHLASGLIHVQAPESLMADIFASCNGQATLDKVIESLASKWDRDNLNSFLQHLFEKGVLYDSSSISAFVWPFVSNPTYFAQAVTDAEVARLVDQACLRHRSQVPGKVFAVEKFPLQELLSQRRSVRVFSGETVGIDRIVQILWSAYGIIANPQSETGFDRHTVPSAGALYPLNLSLAVLGFVDNLSKGLYNVVFTQEGSIGLTKTSSSLTHFYQAFADPLVLRDASGVIVVSGSFAVAERKYGNRALLYIPLEAGHVAQNVHIAATELRMATVEIGGFLEEAMQDTLGLSKDYVPLTTLVFGCSGLEIEEKQPLFEVEWALPKGGSYRLPFSMAMARLAKNYQGSEDWSCGRSENPFLAHTKAIAEAREWTACSLPTTLVKTDIRSLQNAVLPEQVIAFHSEQYAERNFPFHPFDLKMVYAWKEAADVASGKKYFVLADCIYFPYYSEYPCYASANSSGAAAYPTRAGAIERGVLELIERDAFMIVWLNRLDMPAVRHASLPDGIQQRLRNLEGVGVSVTVKDLTLDLAPVLLVFAQSEELHYTTCAACSSFDIYEALDRALMEVESSVYCCFTFGSSEPMLPADVRMTQDHGRLYEQEAFFRQADFLKESRLLKDFGDIGKSACTSWEMLLARLSDQGRNVLVVDLDGLEANRVQSDLYIVKTFVTGLVPMSFGYHEEPCGMQRIYEAPVILGFRSEPLSYDELNRFPHPYT